MKIVNKMKVYSCSITKNSVSGVYTIYLPLEESETNKCRCLEVLMTNKPSIKQIGDYLNEYVDDYVKNKILNGYTWNDFQVYLSNENQMTYKMLYDYLKEQDFNNLPITLKFGDNDNISLYRFENKEDFEAFYKGLVEHIYKTLNEGWEMKSITNWDILKDLLSLY